MTKATKPKVVKEKTKKPSKKRKLLGEGPQSAGDAESQFEEDGK
jgi:hypothetical protein